MPTISMFFGIIVRMYFAPGEHAPLISMRTTTSTKGLWTFAPVSIPKATFRPGRQDLCWRGPNCIRMS